MTHLFFSTQRIKIVFFSHVDECYLGNDVETIDRTKKGNEKREKKREGKKKTKKEKEIFIEVSFSYWFGDHRLTDRFSSFIRSSSSSSQGYFH